MVKRKKVMLGIFVLGIIILGIILVTGYTNRVRYITELVGFIVKDEQETVTNKLFFPMYNGTYDNKKVIFDVDGSKEYLEGKLQEEKYEVTEIEIQDGNGPVDIENGILTLTIPFREKVGLCITAQNIYIGQDYQGKFMGLRRIIWGGLKPIPCSKHLAGRREK